LLRKHVFHSTPHSPSQFHTTVRPYTLLTKSFGGVIALINTHSTDAELS